MNRIRNQVCGSNSDLVGMKRMDGFMRQVFPGRRACKARTEMEDGSAGLARTGDVRCGVEEKE